MRGGLYTKFAQWVSASSRGRIQLVCLIAVLITGGVDYLAGTQITLAAIYVVPISIATWFAGRSTGLWLALLSVCLWVGGDIAIGIYTGGLVYALVNAIFRILFYGFMVVILDRLRKLQRHIELRSERRALALARGGIERNRLKQQLLTISDREQRRMGQDLHDGLCQHLTATALLGHVLADTLEEEGHRETANSRQIVSLLNESVALAKGIAKGLHPVDIQADGLMQALQEFAETTSDVFGIRCELECRTPVMIYSPAVATHIYRIVQEAVNNAVKHAHAKSVLIALGETETTLRITVSDDGIGIAEPPRHNGGMGLHIMADRARAIGGRFSIARNQTGGTMLVCEVSQAA
ncbi:MAG TPA: sensor histidine kinase [Rhizomicrobium sp.]|nr:sensor histidine kinase [Rhizomicrobium sp.]